MIVAYSRLKKILEERRLSVPELHRRLQQQEQGVNIKSLYRLNDAHQPLARLDLRVAGAICRLCDVTLADLVDFSGQGTKLATLAADKQDRLDALMDKNNQGKLSRKEQRVLQDLVRETQEITLHNARILAAQQRRLERD
jgi:DNA-binding Xre family transcriptional regulator